jgi:hypothetical protein
MFLESLTVILWVLFAVPLGLAVWGLVRRRRWDRPVGITRIIRRNKPRRR